MAAAEGVDIPAEEADHILQKVTKGERFSMSFCKDFDCCLHCKRDTIMRMPKVIASRQENKTSMCVDVLKKRSYRVSQKKNALSEPRLLPVLLSPQLGKQLISSPGDELLPLLGREQH